MSTLACPVAFDKRSAEQAAGPMTDLHNEGIANIVGGSEYFCTHEISRRAANLQNQ